MAGVFIATTSGLGRGLLPGWLRIVGFVLAATLLLSVSFIELLVLLIPAWVAVISAWLLVVLAREGADDAEAAQGRLGNDARAGEAPIPEVGDRESPPSLVSRREDPQIATQGARAE